VLGDVLLSEPIRRPGSSRSRPTGASFFLAPITIASLFGIYAWLREKDLRSGSTASASPSSRSSFFVNVCFNGYHGGFAAGARVISCQACPSWRCRSSWAFPRLGAGSAACWPPSPSFSKRS